MKRLVPILLILAGFSSCTNEDASECQIKLTEEYEDAVSWINLNHGELNSFSKIECSTEYFDERTFNGYEEPKDKCHFFDIELEVTGLTITNFTFYGEQGNRLFDFIIYEFDDPDERERFKDFTSHISLYYDKHKEIHEFIYGENKIFLHYYGFP